MKRYICVLGFILPLMLSAIWDEGAHDVGKLYLKITNYGRIGFENAGIWPAGSGQHYIFGAGIWFGTLVYGDDTTELMQPLGVADTIVYVSSTEGFADRGVIQIGDEFIHYTDKTDTSFLHCLRGFAQTDTGTYDVGTMVIERIPKTRMGYNPSSATSEFYPGELPNEPGFTDTTDRIYWSTIDTVGWPGEPIVSNQDSYCIYNDDDTTDRRIGIKIIQIGYAWSIEQYEDFVFLTFKVVNINPYTLDHCYLGAICDADVGNYTDDLVGSILERDLGYAYDSDFYEAGWTTPPGFIGYDFLESPRDSLGNRIGLTAFKILRNPGVPGPGDPDPSNDDETYMVLAGYSHSLNIYHPVDSIETPTDVRFLQSTGPFELEPYDTAKIVIAVICGGAGGDMDDFLDNDTRAQALYDVGFLTNWVHVTYPNGGEVVSGDVNITWEDSSAIGAPMRVKIAWSRDNGETWHVIADTVDLHVFTWNTLDVPDGTRYRIRVTAYDTVCVGEDISDTTFVVNNPGNGVPDVVLIAPQQGRVQDTVRITWYAGDPDGDTLTVDIYLGDTYGEWKLLAAGLPNTGSYLWNTKLTNNGEYRVKVLAYDADTFAADTSTGWIEVVNDHFVLDIPEHISGACNTVTILPLEYNPAELRNHTYDVIFQPIQRIGRDPIYIYKLYDHQLDDTILVDTIKPPLDGTLYIHYSPQVHGFVLEFDVQIDASTYTFYNFRAVQNLSGYDGQLLIHGQDTLGMAHPPYIHRWAWRGSAYEMHWVMDTTVDSLTLRVYDIDNGVEVPYNPDGGTGWYIGSRHARYLDPTQDKRIYLASTVFWFNKYGEMTIPPGDGDIWAVDAAGHKVPCEGNVYRFSVTTGVEETHPISTDRLTVYPTVFYDVLNIRYVVDKESEVELKLYDVMGRLQASMKLGKLTPGTHTVRWKPNLTPGVYFLKLDNITTKVIKIAQ